MLGLDTLDIYDNLCKFMLGLDLELHLQYTIVDIYEVTRVIRQSYNYFDLHRFRLQQVVNALVVDFEVRNLAVYRLNESIYQH